MQKLLALAPVVLLAVGCASAMVEQEANDSCGKQGKKAFIADAKHSGIPLVIESASAMVICVGPDEVTHLPAAFGADVISASNLRGVGIFAVVPGAVADKAGLKPNDIVEEFSGSPVTRAGELLAAINRATAGDRPAIKLRRKGKELIVSAQF